MNFHTTTFNTHYIAGERYTEYKRTEHKSKLHDSSSESSDDEPLSVISSKDWKKMISIAKKSKKMFDLYPWEDNPKDLFGKKCLNRVTWLSQQSKYPFEDYFYFSKRFGYVINLSPSNAIQLLYLCHKVKNRESFDERKFYEGLGDVRDLRAQVQGECCTLL